MAYPHVVYGEPVRSHRFDANREIAERVVTRLERYRVTFPDAWSWHLYAVAQIAAALDAARRERRV
jgi:hypothetical protein